MDTMEISFVLAAIALFYIAAISLQLWKSDRHLIQHSHVMPLNQALPVQGNLIQQLISDMASIAEVLPPEVFVYRARLPNAYIAAMPLRPELFLSDEALEQANESDRPLENLAQLVGHELAHIRLHHALYHAAITFIAQSQSFIFFPLRSLCLVSLNKLESSADLEGSHIAKRYLAGYTHGDI